jgi:hypothetical protein
MKQFQRLVLLFFILVCIGSLNLLAQTDSILFNNGNYLTGAVESMDKGILTFSTDYSDDDFTIEWEKIKEIYTVTTFVVVLDNGKELLASLQTSGQEKLMLIPEEGEAREVSIHDVVNLNPISDKFMDRVSANIDIGYSYTKSQNITQLNVRSFVGYEGKRWSTDLGFNSMQSNQDGVEPTKISDGVWNIRYNLIPRLYALFTVNLLSDSEQKLDLRANTQAGAGAYILRSNRAYWGGKAGVNRNVERYVEAGNDRESWEGFLGTEMNLYDIGDLNLLTSAILYPGITEKGRWRSDIRFDLKYDLPYDFYVSTGFTINWDNQPVEGAEALNLIFLAGLGWEW